jgi:hypothetical protein
MSGNKIAEYKILTELIPIARNHASGRKSCMDPFSRRKGSSQIHSRTGKGRTRCLTEKSIRRSGCSDPPFALDFRYPGGYFWFLASTK